MLCCCLNGGRAGRDLEFHLRLAVFSRRESVMRFVVLAGLLLVLTPGVARASCIALCQCSEPSAWVVSGVGESVTTDAGLPSNAIRVQRVFGDADAGAPSVGSLLEGGGSGLGTVWGASGGHAFVTDGGVTCGNVRFTLEEYAAIVQAGTCQSSLSARGFKQPPCNDFGFCGCSSVSPLLGGLGLLVVALRRRASRA